MDREGHGVSGQLIPKSLTLQLPNERELKNEIRWIYCWNLWVELARQKLELSDIDNSQIDFRFHLRDDDPSTDSKEALLTELQSHIVTKPIQTLSKVKTMRLIKETDVKIQVWEKLRAEVVNFLGILQILSCEIKEGEREVMKEAEMKMLEDLKGKLVEKIVVASKNIDCHYKKMEEAIGRFKKFKCHGLFADPKVARAIDKFNKRSSEPFQLPQGVRSVGMEEAQANSQSVAVELPDFFELLFAGREPQRKKSSPDCPSTKESVIHHMQMVQQGSEWYLAWSQFTETVLQEIKSLAPELGSEVVTIMTKHINQQINLLKTLVAQVRSLTSKVKKSASSEEDMSAMITCLSVFDDFISLIESLKHEASYLIRYVEIGLINLGVLDLHKEPRKLKQQRLYYTRNIIAMKDRHLLSSIEYLYTEMGYLIEYIEFRFHTESHYLEKFGPLTADLLKKYTKNRKDVIQEKEMENLHSVEEMDLANELRAVELRGEENPNSRQWSFSRYHRAEDVRKWVEETKNLKDAFGDGESVAVLKHHDQDGNEFRTPKGSLRFWRSTAPSPEAPDTEKSHKSSKKRFSLKRKS